MKRQKHSLSHFNITTLAGAYLTPVGCVEVLPGDTFQHSANVFIRVAPLNTPVMHPYTVRIHHWFVPTRIIWANFENFITGGSDGLDATVAPTITPGARNIADIPDYLGVPVDSAMHSFSALPIRAYQMIWNNFYRDQDLMTPVAMSTGDGADSTTVYTELNPVCFEKNYYTLCRPWTQKGSDVLIPLTGQAPVTGIGKNNGAFDFGPVTVNDSSGASPSYTHAAKVDSSGTAADNLWYVQGGAATGAYPEIFAQLGAATGGADIIALRDALAIQRFEEARARYGSRYIEYLRYLGIKSSDARLQLPEYLGGGKQTIQFSEVLQSSPTTSGTPVTGVGSLQGHGIAASRSNRYRRFFEEHGYVLSLLSIVPKWIGATSANRMWFKSTKFDYFQKELEHVGQQEVYQREISYLSSTPDALFGYNDRYSEYRSIPSYVTSYMRDNSYNIWHDAVYFTSGIPVTVSAATVEAIDYGRIYQDNLNWRNFQALTMHSIQARRMVSNNASAHVF